MNDSIPDSNSEEKPDSQPRPLRENGLRGFETLKEFLDSDGWHPHRVGEKHVYRCDFAGENSDLRCYAQIRADLEQFLFYVVAPVKVPEELRLAVAEYITRANYGLRIGNFELDYSDGEVRYKSSLDFEGEPLSKTLLKNAIYPAVQTMDHYTPGLMRVIYGGSSPYEAIQEVED